MRVGVTGHQDLAGREDRVNAALLEYLSQWKDLIGISSLAQGADQLFAHRVIDLGGLLEVVIPSAEYERTFPPRIRLEFYKLLRMASTVRILPFDRPSQDAFLEAGKEIVRTADVVTAIWDGEPAEGLGGTADVVLYAESIGRRVDVIW
jgi:hypothetical protein